jgi:hypothetical protein
MSGVLHFRSCLDGGESEIEGKGRRGIRRQQLLVDFAGNQHVLEFERGSTRLLCLENLLEEAVGRQLHDDDIDCQLN